MVVVGIRFHNLAKVYPYDANGLDLRPGTCCVVEADAGQSVGTVSKPSTGEPTGSAYGELRRVLRVAGDEDLRRLEFQVRREEKARLLCLERIRRRKLDMKLVRVALNPDGAKITFYFTAPGRVDFRELVRDLARDLRTRIEMRQIGARDEAKVVGGYGHCGRPLCCSTFLDEFAPVSLKMAKEQNLGMNPTRISGLCGRLMCCLRYENSNCQVSQGRGTCKKTGGAH